VYTVESNVLCRRLIESYVAANRLESNVVVLDRSVAELTAEDINFNKVGKMSPMQTIFVS